MFFPVFFTIFGGIGEAKQLHLSKRKNLSAVHKTNSVSSDQSPQRHRRIYPFLLTYTYDTIQLMYNNKRRNYVNYSPLPHFTKRRVGWGNKLPVKPGGIVSKTLPRIRTHALHRTIWTKRSTHPR